MVSEQCKRFSRLFAQLHANDIPYQRRTTADYLKSRELMEEWHSKMFPPPQDVKYQIDSLNGVAVERVIPEHTPAEQVIIYLHGGSWTECSITSHRHFAAALTKTTGITALTVGYRLAPENPFPAALEDCLSVYRAVLADGVPHRGIVFVGESAGGNLSLATVLYLKEHGEPLPAAVVGISSATDLKSPSESRGGNGFPLARVYAPGQNLANPYVSPLFGDYSDFPALFLLVGGEEFLIGDSMKLAEKASRSGVDVTLRVWQGMGHAFPVFTGQFPEADAAVKEIGNYIIARLSP